MHVHSNLIADLVLARWFGLFGHRARTLYFAAPSLGKIRTDRPIPVQGDRVEKVLREGFPVCG